MYTEIPIEYGQNKCAQKLLSSMDKINVHRNFYQVWTQKMCTEKKMMIDMMILRQNDGHSFIMI